VLQNHNANKQTNNLRTTMDFIDTDSAPAPRRSSMNRPHLPTHNVATTPFRRVKAFFGMSISSTTANTDNEPEEGTVNQSSRRSLNFAPDVQCSMVVGGNDDEVLGVHDSVTERYSGVDPHDLFPTEGDNQLAAFFRGRVRTFKNNVETITTILTEKEEQDTTAKEEDDDDDERFY
jgi:hypothetical protein